jgi:TonB-dependent starch-binding outer membrane protein SusC
MEKFLKKRLFIVALCIMMSSVVFGQQVKVSGTITDASDGSALPGVNVVVKGTLTGTITDLNGAYSISAKPTDVLVFSFIGYIPQEITVGDQTKINVALKIETTKLDEVVVIGYGTIRKADATGSVKSVDLEHFNPGVVASPQDMIVGKMAGVQVVSGGGQPGASSTIRIRSGASLNASNDPLIVIDGVAVDNTGVSGMSNALSTINPNDIENYTVLKDASATAIYGSRASNGVIIITTKKGASGKNFTVSYNGNVSYSTPIKYTDVLSADEFKTFLNEKFPGNATLSLIGPYNTNWQKQIFKSVASHDHNLNFSGGVKNLPYRLSAGYTDQNGILKGGDMKRVTGAISLTPSLLNDHLKFDINAKGTHVDNTFANEGAIGAAISMDPTQPVYDYSSDYAGGFFFWRNANLTPNTLATSNPVSLLDLYHSTSKVNRLLGNIQTEYKVHWLPDLKIKLNLGLDRSNSDGIVTNVFNAPINYAAYTGLGKYEHYTQGRSNELLDFLLNYDKTIAGKHRLSLLGGYSWQHFRWWDKDLDTTGDGTKLISSTSHDTEYFLVSFFGRLNYVYNDKYSFTATLRDDGSSHFAKSNRWGLFPSAAFAWTISKEPFFNAGVVNNLKLRLGYGKTGQQDVAGDNYPYQGLYTYNTTGAYYQFGNAYYQTLRPSGYDVNIRWESTATYNVGFDYGLLNDRITGDIDAYYKYTTDLINNIPVPAGTNLSNYINTNVGNMENRGIELSINGKIITKKDLYWEVGFNATYQTSKIKKLLKVEDPNYDGVPKGGISGGVGNNIQIHSEGYAPYSFYVYQQVYDSNGKPIDGLYVDRNKDGGITSDDKYRFHSSAPDWFMGFSSMLKYKAWDFNINGRISLGNYVYNNIASNNGWYGYMVNTGYLTNTTKSMLDTQFSKAQYFSDYYIENASFLKIDNVSLGYNFKNVLNKLNLRAYLTCQNLLTVTKYSGLDPEVFNGIDNNLYPRPRIFMLGLSVTL